ncbi:cbb3-type cytochrome oxidase assembly protein CcoS [uncultured Aliiroseovarius sp.]|uniref:cbb3-type cytochrome oxidase assembly protein CcoS n=1 Tax=uncultured Aliiroseovarius sp. TaxID=1658783 RepID=UPI00259763C9|nr:cbb3-type cytochrome oxidase assembly protein CcoS [uncultured Aliiroseovarius sp.]
MSLLLLIALSICLGLLGLGAFLWALRNGQFDDPEGAGWRVLLVENPPETNAEKSDDANDPTAQSTTD